MGLEEQPWKGFNTIPPHEREQQTTSPVAEGSTEAPVTETKVEAPVTTEAPPAPAQEPKVDEFIETFNKRYATQYKSDDDLKALFSLPSKVSEYENRLKDYDSLKGSVDNYKKELEETKSTYLSDLLSKPLLRKAYVAEQLQAKYPDRDARMLGEIAMSDIDAMSDIEAIAKEKMISVKGLTLDEAKLAKLADFGIDVSTNPEEWDSVAKARVKIAGAEAKDRMKQLLQGIELPKTVTKEEREAVAAKAFEDRVKKLTPFKEVFNKFDTYKNGDFEFVPPDEFKSKLGEIFDGMFLNTGLDVTEENIATAELLKKALFIEEYFPKMLELHEKQVRTKVKEETDKLLHNDTPPNTATATDQATVQSDKPGLKDFFGTKEERVTKL